MTDMEDGARTGPLKTPKDTRWRNIRIFAYTLYQDFRTEDECLGVVNAEKSRMVGRGGAWGFQGLFSMSQAMFEDETVILHRFLAKVQNT